MGIFSSQGSCYHYNASAAEILPENPKYLLRKAPACGIIMGITDEEETA
jgi:hypothetical protein